MTTTVKGRLIFLDESSNTGGFWAFIPADSYNPFPSDSYILHDGDQLVVYDEPGTTVEWQGTISLQAVPLQTQGVDGFWIRNTQLGVDLRTWANWFEQGRSAQVTTANVVTQY